MVAANQTPSQARSAHAAIKGYEYQFDRTVLELLAADASSVVTIEGIEDIDLVNPDVSIANQVKYYASQRYASPKSLQEPIRLMLEHFRTGANWSYVLYVHFGDPGGLPSSFTLDELKHCLTYSPQKKPVVRYFDGMTDSQLQDFCGRVEIRSGDTFDDQEASAVAALATALTCSDEEVLAIYLAKARDFVHQRARSSFLRDRQVSRADLVTFLEVKELLFDRWQFEKLGQERYVRAQIRRLKQARFHDTKLFRGVAVELSQDNMTAILEFATQVGRAQIGRLNNSKPWAIIVSGELARLTALKTNLVRLGVAFNDGYETIEFSADAFNTPPVVNLTGASNKVKAASYVIRVVARENFESQATPNSKLSRLIVIGPKADWHDAAADEVFALKEYEPGLVRALLGEIA